MASLQPPLTVRVIVEGSKYKINVRRPAHERLRDVCRLALTQHLAAIFEIEEDEAESMVDRGSIKVTKVQEEDGSSLRPSDTIKESGLLEGSLLKIKLKISDEELSERVRSLSLAHNDSSPNLFSGSLKSGSLSSSNRKQESSSSDSNFILEMRINGSTSKIGVKSEELLRDVCQLAIVKHIRNLHQLNKEDAVAMIESQQIKVLSVEEGGTVLDLDETVFRNGLSGAATVNVTLTGLTSKPPLSDDGIAKPSPEPSMSSAIFQIADIKKATNNFSDQNIVGKGGQATVYKGSLFGSMVAVKKYQSLDFTDMELEIEVLQKVRHPNVILLMGCCREEKAIISEFMEGGSLLDRLRDKPEKLSWSDRYRVAEEIVSAISYLHHCDILHRDLKPANILFDSHGTVKVADMGMAKLSAATVTASVRVGTAGYMDPSAYLCGKNSKSMDVYTLGLIILQLYTHKESVRDIHAIFDKVPQGQKRNCTFGIDLFKEAMVAFDSSTSSEEMALTLLEVGLRCAEQDSRDRPTLEDVTGRLKRVERGFVTASDGVGNNSSIDNMKLTDLISFAKKGNVEAQFLAGRHYQMGYSVKLNKSEAVKWYEKAVKNGHIGAMDALEGMFENHYLSLSKQSWFKGRRLTFILDHATRGVPTAQFFYGKCYFEGIGVSNNKYSAVWWYIKAAEQGHKEAQYSLAMCYYLGSGVDKDMAIAVQWYTKAEEQGESRAQYSLGVCYEKGHGVERDMAIAVQFYTKAALQGHSDAQHNLALCYVNGQGVGTNMAIAVQWYTKSAEQGHKEAQCFLAMCYYNGWGVKEDMTIAVHWYTKAAEQGHSDAQHMLARCYSKGQGVEKDMAMAITWYTKAAEQGHSSAKCYLAERFSN